MSKVRSRDKVTVLLKLLPFICLNTGILISALIKSLQISLGYYPIIGSYHLSFDYYKQVLTSSTFQHTLMYTVYLTLTSAFLSLFLGLLLALFLVKLSDRYVFCLKIVSLPIALPHIIVVMIVLQLFAQTGLVSRLCLALGVIQEASDFPLWVHDKKGIGIILVFLYKQIPYVAVSVLALLKQMSTGYLVVAKNLGASSWQRFWRITLPLVQPTLTTLFIIIFAFAFGSFEVPYMLGTQSNETLAVSVYTLFGQADLSSRPKGMALNVIMTLLCTGVTLISLWLSKQLPGGKRVKRRVRKEWYGETAKRS